MSRTVVLTMLFCALPLQLKAQEGKLPYNLQSTLKNAKYYTTQVGKSMPQIAGETKAIEGHKELASLKYQVVAQLTAQCKRLRGYVANAQKHFAKLPAGHAEVKGEAAKLAAHVKALDACEPVIHKALAALNKIRDIRNYPSYQKDFKQLDDITRSYRDTAVFTNSPDKAIACAEQFPNALRYQKALWTRYLPLVKQQTRDGQNIYRFHKRFSETIKAFRVAATAFVKAAPAQVRKHLADALTWGEKGVAQKRPMFFGANSGVEQQMGWANDRLRVFLAVSGGKDETATKLKEELAATRVKLNQMAASLKSEIIAQNKVPSDRYRGSDKAALLAGVKAAWLKSHPKDQLLAIRFPRAQWARDTRWRHSGGGSWYKTDYSKLQARVIVKGTGTLAFLFTVTVHKDHMKGDKISYYPWKREADPQPINKLPLAKLLQK